MSLRAFLLPFLLLVVSCSNESKAPLTGKELYTKNCVACHGSDGKKGLANATDLSASTISIGEQKHIITNGKNTMAPFKLTLNETEIDSIVTYIQELR